MSSREEVTFVGRMLFELVPSGSLAEQEARLHTQHGPLGCATKSSCLRAREEEQDMPKTPLGVLGMIAEPTGTDGCRILCRQFYTSSLPRLENCILRCDTFWREMNYFKVVTLLISSADDRGRNIQTMVFQLTCGRLSCSVWWSRRNRSAP